MALDKKNIMHLAHLAKFELDDQEVEQYARELSDILAYVEKINKLKLTNVKQSLSGVDARYVMPLRPDEVAVFHPEAIKQAPDFENNLIAVPHVFENNEK